MQSTLKTATLEIFVKFPPDIHECIATAQRRYDECIEWLPLSAQPFPKRIYWEYLPEVTAFEASIDAETIRNEFARKAKKLDLMYDGKVEWVAEPAGLRFSTTLKK